MTTDDTFGLTGAERWKLRILAEGVGVTDSARRHLDEVNRNRALTPADYTSTSGLIIVIDQDVWVNAPIADQPQNAEFVREPSLLLDLDGDGFNVRR